MKYTSHIFPQVIQYLFLTFCFLVQTEAAEYSVSPDGDDRNDGSRAAPFRTISRAADRMKPGDTCLVRRGTYRETVRPAHSGKPGMPVVFRNWPGERPLVLGTDPVTGWIRTGKNRWSASMAWDLGNHNQVFINGKPGYEARWPSRKSADPLEWEGVPYERGSDNSVIVCRYLPGHPRDFWKGAVIWVLGGNKWTSWSSRVTGSRAGGEKIRIAGPPAQGSARTNMSPSHPGGGRFYLVGKKAHMNVPEEWFLDASARKLHICVKPEADPNSMRIEAKRRDYAFDLNGRDHIHVIGMDIRGASVRMEECSRCMLRDIRAHWIAHTRGGDTAYSLNETLGISVEGHHNTVRDSEIAYSAGNGIVLRGYRNSVINCWIHHTDYTGSYDAPVKAIGREMLISHNTINDTGRDCIRPIGQAHIIQYNNIFNMGRICRDLGGTYVATSDGGGTEIHHNWIHADRPQRQQKGVYLDNYTSFYLVYCNVIWNMGMHDIQLNRPSLFNMVVNNTGTGTFGSWGRWTTDWMYGCAYVNNAVGKRIQRHSQTVMKNNLTPVPAGKLNNKSVRTFTAPSRQGLAVPGIIGHRPYVGAYAPGKKQWKAGHDFKNPPDPVYRPADTPLHNLIRHGSFDWREFLKSLGPWKPTGAGSAGIVRGKGGIFTSYSERNAINRFSVKLDAQDEDGITQTVSGLRSEQTYEAGAWVKCSGGASVTLAVSGINSPASVKTRTRAGKWQYLRVRFSAGAHTPDTAALSLTKTGGGTAYIDDVSLVGIVSGMEPVKPGLAR